MYEDLSLEINFDALEYNLKFLVELFEDLIENQSAQARFELVK